MSSEPKVLTRDVEASVVPIGTKVTLQKGEQAFITQSLGGSYTVVVNGNMFRIAENDADALGLEVRAAAAPVHSGPMTQEELEKKVWEALKTCYDPEIPVNIVDLGLIYNIDIDNETGHVEVTMTLTALGCPLAGEVISEVEMRVGEVENVQSCKCNLTFDPPWSPDRMTEDAKWELGMV